MEEPRAGPVGDALRHGAAAPAAFAGWPTGEALRRLRLSRGLNRRQLAERAGTSPSLVGRVEKGADLRLGTLRRLYAALGLRVVVLPAPGGDRDGSASAPGRTE